MAEVNLFGPILVPMKEIFSKIIFMVLVNTNGLTVEFTKENGLIIKWKEREFLLGVTVVVMSVAIKMIRSMAMELLNGLMVVNI